MTNITTINGKKFENRYKKFLKKIERECTSITNDVVVEAINKADLIIKDYPYYTPRLLERVLEMNGKVPEKGLLRNAVGVSSTVSEEVEISNIKTGYNREFMNRKIMDSMTPFNGPRPMLGDFQGPVTRGGEINPDLFPVIDNPFSIKISLASILTEAWEG